MTRLRVIGPRQLPTGDGLLDLYVANNGGVNFLYHNEGGGSFSKVTTGDVVTDSGNSRGAAWADYDGLARLATSQPEIE